LSPDEISTCLHRVIVQTDIVVPRGFFVETNLEQGLLKVRSSTSPLGPTVLLPGIDQARVLTESLANTSKKGRTIVKVDQGRFEELLNRLRARPKHERQSANCLHPAGHCSSAV